MTGVNQWGPYQSSDFSICPVEYLPRSQKWGKLPTTIIRPVPPAPPQQGTPAQNAPVSISGGVAAAALQTFRWE
jgi:hypothetical protein